MQDDRDEKIFSATEEKTPVAFSDWTQKLKFDRSFTAKLILSDEKVKEYYADIASAILSYKQINSSTNWSGVSFRRGRERFAYISLVGKTLQLYLAVEPEKIESGRYKAKDVSLVKAKASTPSMLKIRSDGAKKHAVKLIADLAEKYGFTVREQSVGVKSALFKKDSFNNLVTRGLIRIVRKGSGESAATVETPSRVNRRVDDKLGVFADTAETIDSLTARHPVYDRILSLLAEGNATARLSRKLVLRSVDEIWVRAIEDCLPSLDELIRNPNHVIAETEEVLPIEKTKRVSGRSIAHLCRHTDYLKVQGDGELTPTKMLNVFREDSLLTYENKFLNTLISRLYSFVNARYKVAKEYGADERLDSFEYENSFNHGDAKAKIKISVEYSERNLDSDVKNILTDSGLWKRVERLQGIVLGYANSTFAKSMGRNYVRPPIMRTNAIIKNKYFRECLALWEFVESYDDAGYGILVEDRAQEPTDEFVKEAYGIAAMQYALFRHNMEYGFDEEVESESVTPTFALEEARRKPFEETLVEETSHVDYNDDLTFALRVALLADERYVDRGEVKTFLNKTFHAKLSGADYETKSAYAEIVNKFNEYAKVRVRRGNKYASVYGGRRVLARITLVGKTLKLYAAIAPEDMPSKYNAVDVSDKRVFADTPSCVKVKSKRGLKYAKEIIDFLAEDYGLDYAKTSAAIETADDYPTIPLAEMLQRGWVSFAKRRDFARDKAINVSFGSSKSQVTARAYEESTRLAVKEPNTRAEDVAIGEVAASDALSTQEGRALAREISSFIRPTADYSNPTEYGVDSADEFIKDAMQEEERTGDDEDR